MRRKTSDCQSTHTQQISKSGGPAFCRCAWRRRWYQRERRASNSARKREAPRKRARRACAVRDLRSQCGRDGGVARAVGGGADEEPAKLHVVRRQRPCTRNRATSRSQMRREEACRATFGGGRRADQDFLFNEARSCPSHIRKRVTTCYAKLLRT
eukprot:2475731-Pleurochrysis_carterae.AAC.1